MLSVAHIFMEHPACRTVSEISSIIIDIIANDTLSFAYVPRLHSYYLRLVIFGNSDVHGTMIIITDYLYIIRLYQTRLSFGKILRRVTFFAKSNYMSLCKSRRKVECLILFWSIVRATIAYFAQNIGTKQFPWNFRQLFPKQYSKEHVRLYSDRCCTTLSTADHRLSVRFLLKKKKKLWWMRVSSTRQVLRGRSIFEEAR